MNKYQEAFDIIQCAVTHGGIGSNTCQRCGKHTFDEQFEALTILRDYIYDDQLLDCQKKNKDCCMLDGDCKSCDHYKICPKENNND